MNAMKSKNREYGLFKNGNRWWMRLAGGKRVSTGTDREQIANRVARMVHNFEAEHTHRDLLSAVDAGTLELIRLYDHHAAGTLDILRRELAQAAVVDPDLEPYVVRWHAEQLLGRSLSDATRDDYVRQVRALIPEGIPFPCSQFTEDKIQSVVNSLPVGDSTKRRYVAAWRLFCRFVRRRIPGVADPFEFAKDWMPAEGESRTIWWTHRKVRSVLDRMSGEPRAAMALVFGTGMELGAIRNLTYDHILGDRTIVAPGTKNAHRRDRTILVDAWADRIFRAWLTPGFPTAKIFKMSENELRTAFYRTQVELDLVEKPVRGPSSKMLWGQVAGLHRIHDARHSYAINRLLGTDGEPKRTMKFVAQQLGHANEIMLARVYAKANIANRHELALAEMEMDKPAVRERPA